MSNKARKKYSIGPDVNLSRTIIRDKKGRRITPARAERLANAAIESVVERLSLTGPAARSPEIKARVPEKLKAALQKEAKRRGETSSELVCEALEKFLKGA